MKSETASLSSLVDWVNYHLPHQGTLQHFVHHNPLEAFESLTFSKACAFAAMLYRGQCFLSQARYLELLAQHKISRKQVLESLCRYLPSAGERLQHQVLLFLCDDPPHLKTLGLIERALRKKRAINAHYALWEDEIKSILDGLSFSQDHWDHYAYPTHAAFLLQAQGVDINDIINPMLAKFLSVYSDPGSAYWRNETYTQGLWQSFCENYVSGIWLENQWAQKIRQALNENPYLSDSVEKNMLYYLQLLGIDKAHHGAYLLSLALRLKGWASFFNQLEHHPEESLDDTLYSVNAFLLVKLVFEYVVVKGFIDPLEVNLDTFSKTQKLRYEKEQKAEHLWNSLCFFERHGQIAQGPWRAPAAEKLAYVKTIATLSYDKRLFIYQQALENTFAQKQINALCAHNRQRISQPKPSPPVASFQYITCIDDREGSLRRYVERLDPACETFGIAGYFEMNMHFKAFNDVRFRKLCPGNISQTFKVRQGFKGGAQESKHSRLYALVYRAYDWHSRVSIWAFFATLLTGVFAVFPLLLKLFFPAFELKIRQKIKRFFVPLSSLEDFVFHAEGNPEGITYEEGADKVFQLLKTIGLLADFTPFVLVVGHGSSSVNNPHEYGYNCGACGGGKGMANARVFAKIANHSQVRQHLSEKYGLFIPEATRFVGGYHDTCKDTILWFNTPLSVEQKPAFTKIKALFETALQQNILERGQEFHNISSDMSSQAVIQKVRSRVNQIAEARPEYNHATNALCIMGRRELTRGFSLHRRAFLCSYNPFLDLGGEELARLMAAAVPVCTGINLEYYFSSTDTEIFGCGSKLNHNIVDNYAVMSGFASDLRLGLSRQMVETHLPKRMLFIVESTPEILQSVIENNRKLKQLFENEWANLYVVSEPFERVYRFDKGTFVCFPLQELKQS